MKNRTVFLAEFLLDKVKKLGINQADVLSIESESICTNARFGKLEGIEQAESSEIGLRVIKDGKQLTLSSTESSEESANELANKAASMIDSVPKDDFCGLADKTLFMKGKLDLDLMDNTKLNHKE